MSEENRKRVYLKLKAEGRLDHDDGALEKEFGKAEPEPKKLDQVEPKKEPKKSESKKGK